MTIRSAFIALFCLMSSSVASAQQGYEFEVYDTDIGRKGSSELELHTNYVADGLKSSEDGLIPTHRAIRSSFEASRTLANWLRASFYVTASAGKNRDFAYVGNRARITTIAPQKWQLPVALGVATEFGYSRPGYSENRWALEITPIISKSFGSATLTLNPAFERGLDRQSEREIEFEPRARMAYAFGDEATLSIEYYGGLGAIDEKYPLREQRHQVFARILGEVAPRLEIGAGIGRGLTPSSDRWVLATVIEYEFPE